MNNGKTIGWAALTLAMAIVIFGLLLFGTWQTSPFVLDTWAAAAAVIASAAAILAWPAPKASPTSGLRQEKGAAGQRLIVWCVCCYLVMAIVMFGFGRPEYGTRSIPISLIIKAAMVGAVIASASTILARRSSLDNPAALTVTGWGACFFLAMAVLLFGLPYVEAISDLHESSGHASAAMVIGLVSGSLAWPLRSGKVAVIGGLSLGAVLAAFWFFSWALSPARRMAG